VRPRLDLDDGRDAVLFDAGYDSGKAIPRGLGDGPLIALSPLCLQSADIGEAHEALSAARPTYRQSALGFPAPQRVD